MSNEIFSLKQFGISIGYDRLKKLGDPLEEINRIVNWEGFRGELCQNTGVGRHGYDPILLVKIAFLQASYGISDEELEYQVADRISFQRFLGFPNTIPDYTTVWYFREELAKDEKAEKIWEEIKIHCIKENKDISEYLEELVKKDLKKK